MAQPSPVQSPGGGDTMEGGRPEDTPPAVVTFFQPQVPGQVLVLFSLISGSEAVLKRFLPKSHLSKVIIRDNISVQRVHELKLKHIEENKRKMGNLCDHMMKKFMNDQQKKMNRWKKEYSHYQRMLERIDQRALLKARTSIFALPEPSKAREVKGWKSLPQLNRLKFHE